MALLAPLLLLSCKEEKLTLVSTSSTATDGYVFEKKEFVAKTTLVRVVEHPDQASIVRSYNREPGAKAGDISPDKELLAYSFVAVESNGDTICTMHIVDPAISYQPEFVGHEFLHCQYGNFHPKQ